MLMPCLCPSIDRPRCMGAGRPYWFGPHTPHTHAHTQQERLHAQGRRVDELEAEARAAKDAAARLRRELVRGLCAWNAHNAHSTTHPPKIKYLICMYPQTHTPPPKNNTQAAAGSGSSGGGGGSTSIEELQAALRRAGQEVQAKRGLEAEVNFFLVGCASLQIFCMYMDGCLSFIKSHNITCILKI